MALREEVDKIIERRKEKIPAIKEAFDRVQGITEKVKSVDTLRGEMLQNSERFGIDTDVRAKIEELNIYEYLEAFQILQSKYDEVIERFNKDEINIAVVGAARQGKSKLLQSVCGLDDYTIPAFVSDDCTGATSVIKNVPGMGENVSAKINFMTESEMVNCVQKYLDTIFIDKSERVGSFNSIGTLNLDELEKKIRSGAPEITKFEHLSKYVKHFNEWKKMVEQGSVVVNNKEEIQQYVAQHNGKEEGTPERKDYYYYLAVKDVTISCEFTNSDVGKIVLRDTIGLGDTSLGIEDKMLEAIGGHSDAAIIVRRPEVGTGKFDANDEKIYDKLFNKFENRNMDKWLFWLINKTEQGSVYGDNENRCMAFDKKIREKGWKIADHLIVNVADENSVNDNFENKILKKLIENIDAIDEGILEEIREQTQVVYNKYSEVQNAIDAVLLSESVKNIDRNEFLDNKWKTFYERTLMKALKGYKEELEQKQDEECEEFRKSIEKILSQAKQLVPSKESLLEDLEAGGNNRPFEVYSHSLDKLRNDFTEKFIKVDELIFDKQVREFKERIVDIFAEDDCGRLKYVIPLAKDNDKVSWLKSVSDKLFDKNRYSQFNTAFGMIYEFDLSVRGFLMHRIRSRIDRLEGSGYQTKESAVTEIAEEIHRTLERRVKDVCEEIKDEMKEGFYKDPNRIFYAVAAEFYDRLNFSYTENSNQDVENSWKSLYRDHCHEVWRTEFQENQDMSDLYNSWSMLVNQLRENKIQDFELVLN